MPDNVRQIAKQMVQERTAVGQRQVQFENDLAKAVVMMLEELAKILRRRFSIDG